jgi:formyl-CoA transferase
MSQLLSGLVVLDLTRALAGPHAGMMLGDLGARVIKVEPPDGGDQSRSWGPPFVGRPDDQQSTYFLSCNRNKESVTADLRDPAGKDLFRKLVARADMLLENFRPGGLERLGFSVSDLHEINPQLIVLSITGFGHDGPEAARAGYDQIAQGEAGLMSVTGTDTAGPMRVGVPISALLAGMYGVAGLLAALHERHITGRGRVVRTSLLAATVGVHAFQGTRWTVAGEVPAPEGNHNPSIAPYGLFHASDAPIQVACGSERLWRRFADALSIDAADPRFATNRLRVQFRDILNSEINTRLSKATAQHWLGVLTDAEVPVGRVRSIDEVYTWDQTTSQGLLIEVEHPSLGKVRLPGPPLRFDGQAFAGARRTHQPPPRLGEHNESVAAWLRDGVSVQ